MTGPPRFRPLLPAHAFLVVFAAVTGVVAALGFSRRSEPAPASTESATPAPAPAPPPAEGASTGSQPAGAAADLGTQVFRQRCVLCHGAEGRGDGIGGKALNPKPRNFHDRAYMSTRTDAQ